MNPRWRSIDQDALARQNTPALQAKRAPSIKVVDENIIMPVERALGVIWDTNSDCFVYEVVNRNIADTRRGRHPIVLSPDHDFTRLIVMNCHERLKHEGVDHVRNELRQQY